MHVGNHNQLENWVHEHTQDLYVRALFKVSDEEIARDLVQETFLAAAERVAFFKGTSSPKTWLFSILNHKIVDYYRNKKYKLVPLEEGERHHFFDADNSWHTTSKPQGWGDEEKLLDNPDFLNILQRCLDALPNSWSTCVKLKYLKSKKGHEICQELDISTTNYWQMIHRAKLQLRECIEMNWI